MAAAVGGAKKSACPAEAGQAKEACLAARGAVEGVGPRAWPLSRALRLWLYAQSAASSWHFACSSWRRWSACSSATPSATHEERA
eukprot:scaffold2933_cov31-Tisochrysis_lutea.AAC.8